MAEERGITPPKKPEETTSLDERLLQEQTLVNERRHAPGEQAPSARRRTPAERDRAAARTIDEAHAEVPPVETGSVKKVAQQSRETQE